MNNQLNLKNPPKLSIVITCYNMGDYISETVKSVLSYRSQDVIEIIIIDDGSDDYNTLSQLDSLETIKNLTVVHQQNKGLANARNQGFKIARAEYVLVLDADNKIRPIYIKESIKILNENNEIDLVYGDLMRFGLEEKQVTIGEFNLAKITIKNYIDACVVVRKKSWKKINGYDENMPIMGYEDWDFNLRLAYSGCNFFYLEEICFDYRVRKNSMLENSNNYRDILLKYMFNKRELSQVKLIRDKLIEGQGFERDLANMKKRYIIKNAIKFERLIKKFFN